jgi:hypothetical protein
MPPAGAPLDLRVPSRWFPCAGSMRGPRFHPANVLFTQPPRAFTLQRRDAERRAKRGAEAPGQRTARGRLL